jgi:putative transposase
MARVSLAVVHPRAEHHFDARIRLQAEKDRLRQEVALLKEEIRIKDSRMERLAAQRRPYYPPIERLAILELRAARGWSAAETARRLLVTPLTVAAWTSRLDEEGPDALVQIREPVNRFPDFVGYLVRRLKALCPTMGTRRIASVLARADLHLGATTVRRMLAPTPTAIARNVPSVMKRVVTAKRPNHVWHLDLSTVPIGFGFWIPWLPLSLPQRWPFCWWIAVVVDHYSRRVMGLAVFLKEPTAADVTRFLGRICKAAGARPGHIITDHGTQFTAAAFAPWCRLRGIQQRLGAIGKYGSIAVVERFLRSLKDDCTRAIIVSVRRVEFERELAAYSSWFNAERPHSFLRGATPDEVYFGTMPGNRRPRFEPRSRWPRRSVCARPQALVRGRPGVELELSVDHRGGRRHLPVVSLRRAA